MDVCVSGVIQPIERFIRRALERERNILRGVRRGRGAGEIGGLWEELRLHNNPLRTPPMDVCVSGVISRLGGSLEEHLRENVTYWAESEGGGGKQGVWGRNYVYTTIL